MLQKAMIDPKDYRKYIHLSSLWIPLLYNYLDYFQMLVIMIFATFCLVVWDTQRNSQSKIGALVRKINDSLYLDHILKPHELNGHLTGASLMMISGLLCLILFPKEVFIISFTVLVISDATANFVGRNYGSPLKATSKSLMGSKAFAMSSFIISFILGNIYGLELLPLAIASITAAYFEHCSNVIKIDDNFIVPITFSLAFVISAAVI